MRFGFLIPNWAPFNQDLHLRLAVAADDLGFHHVFFTDHMTNPHAAVDGFADEAVEAWTLISHVAALTSRVRLGTGVTPMGVRAPGVLAKQVATVDRLSRGRIDLGVGTGSARGSFALAGSEFGTPSARVAQMREGVQLMRKLWTEPVVNFDGEFYSADNVVFGPKPIQQPGPPIWLGGFTPPMLKFAADAADGWLPWNRPLDQYRDYLRQLNDFADEAGRRGKITPGTVLMVVPDEFRDTPLLTGQGTPPHLTVSTIEACVADYADAGAEVFIILLFPAEGALDTAERLAARLL